MALSKLTKVQTLGIGSNIEVVGVITTGQFKSGTSNLHSSGVELTNLNVSGIATIGGNVSIGGTLTYQDVTNIDSVGLITARSGINVSGGTATFAGDLSIADKIIHTGDTNTAIRFPSADTITAETGGTERLRINSDGDMGVGTNSPVARLHVHNSGTGSGDHAYAYFTTGDTGSDASSGLTIGVNATATAVVNFREAGNLSFGTSSTERMRIASDGKLFTTRTHASSNTGNHPALDIDTYSNNGSPQAAMATGIDFSVEGVHKKRLAVTYADSSAGTGDWIFYRDQGNNAALRITSGGQLFISNNTGYNESAALISFATDDAAGANMLSCLLYTSPSPRD